MTPREPHSDARDLVLLRSTGELDEVEAVRLTDALARDPSLAAFARFVETIQHHATAAPRDFAAEAIAETMIVRAPTDFVASAISQTQPMAQASRGSARWTYLTIATAAAVALLMLVMAQLMPSPRTTTRTTAAITQQLDAIEAELSQPPISRFRHRTLPPS